ncbi:hypothetical protein BRC81_14390, partial [Halobacteriales archaeon QS_1_68_20]
MGTSADQGARSNARLLMESSETNAELRVRQQEVVAELGQRALEESDLDLLMHDATVAVAETLDTDYCEVLELSPGGDELLLREGVGWGDQVVDEATVSTDRDSQAGYTLLTDEPVIVEDLRTEGRFAGAELLTSHDVVSGISVIVGSVDDPWGVLGTHTTERREFTEDDANFVRSVANVLASAIENERPNRKLRTIHERITNGILAVDEQWEFTHVNQQAEEILGHDADELLGRRLWEVFPALEDTEFEERYREAMVTQEPVSFESYYPPFDAWFEEHVYPSETGLSVYFRDVTERKQRESELEEIYGRISEAFLALDENWRFTHLNDRAHELINPDGRTLVGNNVWEEFPEAVGRKFKSKYEQAMYEQETVSFEEYYPEPLDRWFEVRAYPSETGLSVYFRDVTDRKEHEQDLERTRRRFEAIFEDPNILVGLLEPDGTVVDINRTAMEYVDADREAVTGEPFWETPWWGEGTDVQDEVREWVERAAAGEYVDFEANLTRPNGDWYTVDGVFRPVTNDDGDVVSIIVSDRDVTERKRREYELERSEQRYRTLVEHFPNGAVALVDGDLCYQTVGGDPKAVAGVTVEEVEGSPVEEVLPSKLADELVPYYEAALQGESGAFEIELDGRVYQFQVVPVRDDSGDIFGALGMSQDVTERIETQRKLEESEQRYRTLAEYFPNSIVTLFDHDLEYTLAAGRGFEMIPVEPEELEGRSVYDVWPEETANALEPAFRAALAGEERSVELAYAGREWVVHAVPITDERGEVFAGMTMAQDITERKERERRLEESERRYRTLVEHFPNGAVGLFDENLEYVVGGGEALEDLDIPKEDVIGASIHDRFPPALVEEIEQYSRAALDGESNTFEYHAHGRDTWAHTLPVRDDDGEIFAGMIMAQDITERKEAERELERALDLLEKTERIADVAGWEVDPDTGEPYWSDHLFEMLDVDYDEQPTLDQALDVYHTEEDRAIVENAVEEALETGESFDVVAEFPRPEGDVGKLRVQGEPEVRDGETVSLRGAVQDVTERVERERQLEELIERLEESNERLEQFAYAASHDLQEPLRMVSSYL